MGEREVWALLGLMQQTGNRHLCLLHCTGRHQNNKTYTIDHFVGFDSGRIVPLSKMNQVFPGSCKTHTESFITYHRHVDVRK